MKGEVWLRDHLIWYQRTVLNPLTPSTTPRETVTIASHSETIAVQSVENVSKSIQFRILVGIQAFCFCDELRECISIIISVFLLGRKILFKIFLNRF